MFMEAEGDKSSKKPKTEWRNVFIGRNPDTGRPYFERRKVPIPDPNKPRNKHEEKPDWTPGSKWRGNYTADLDAPDD